MQNRRSLLLVPAALLALLSLPIRAQAATPSTPAEIVSAVKLAPAADRAALVQAALAANPQSAPALLAALIASLPNEAAAYTELVVQDLLAATLPADIKGAILARVAQDAVAAALQIPPTAVADLLTTVNAVKAALAEVPTEFETFVAAYTTHLYKLPETVLITSLNLNNDSPAQTVLGLNSLPTQTILSDDTL